MKSKFSGVVLVLIIVALIPISLSGQSPANLTRDIAPSHGFTTTQSIENTFNNARRQEEIQLGLATNTIRNLDLPTDGVWDNMSEEAKMLYLLNDERTARANINYGQGPVKGLPFAGVAQGVDNVSNNYAQTLFINGSFTHTFGGTSPSSRLAAAYSSTCREFISRSENLYIALSSANSGFPRTVEQAVYGFNYEDAGSNWGHREMNLLQDQDLQGRPWGFTDNEGQPGSEGYIGVGVYRGTNYGNWPFGVILVLNYIDPSPSCSYTPIESNSSPPADPCDEDILLTSVINEDEITTDQTVSISGNASIIQPTTISAQVININAGFSINSGSCLQILNDGCNYTGVLNCEDTQEDSNSGNNDNNTSGSGICASPIDLSCGQVHEGGTHNFQNNWSSYGVNNGWTGPEVIYELTLTPGASGVITLSDFDEDLDLLLATSCSSSSVALSSTNPDLVSETLNFSTSSGGTFYIIVDGWQGAASDYRLSYVCSSQLSSEEVSTKSAGAVVKERRFVQVGQPYLEQRSSIID